MNKYFSALCLTFCLFGKIATAQTDNCNLVYSYDNAGNRIERILDCVPHYARSQQVEDSLTSTPSLIESVYPNPSSGNVNVVLSNAVTSGQLIVTDNLGRQLYISEISGQTISLNISNFEAGVYYITVRTGGQSFENSIVKE